MIYINNSHSQSTPITRYHTLPYPLTEKGVKQAQRNQSDGMYVISNIDGRWWIGAQKHQPQQLYVIIVV